MRKFIQYILILIILAGIFSPLIKTHADEMGVCVNEASKGISFSTSSECGAGMFNNKKWCGGVPATIPAGEGVGTCVQTTPSCNVSFSTQSMCGNTSWWSSQLPPTSNDPKGTCYSKGKTYTNWTRNACTANSDKAFWDANDAPRGTCVINGETKQNWQENGCRAYGGTWNMNSDNNLDQAGTCTTTNKATGEKSSVSSLRKDCKVANPPDGYSVSFIPDNNVSSGSGESNSATNPPDPRYTLLAPLPCAEGSPGCVGGQLTTFDPTGPNKIGDYLNIMLRIFIGICAVLAVIMIVIGGMEYMTSELISNKEHGKEKIRDAILGLLLALGAYTLLFTINPNLLKSDLESLATQEVTVSVDESTATAVATGSTETSGPTAGCPEGMVNASGIQVCKSIANGVNALMAKAREQNIPLAGGGFRSVATQTQLRIKNCHGDTTSANPNPPCSPPTAVPGNSMHNSGQAIDFTCSGILIQDRTNQCFVWLSANAGIAGLSNFSKEQWHWSTNGR